MQVYTAKVVSESANINLNWQKSFFYMEHIARSSLVPLLALFSNHGQNYNVILETKKYFDVNSTSPKKC